MNQIKKQFPFFKQLPNLVYLDNGATTLKPQSVIHKMMEYYTEYSANIHRGVYAISEKATGEYELARTRVAKFLGARDEKEIVFTSGTTAGINLIAGGWGNKNITEGDEVVVSQMEHHSNFVPWQQLALREKAIFKVVKINNQLGISPDEIKREVTPKTKVLAITHVGNVLGTINPIAEIVKAVKLINPEILVVVDGAQAVAHLPVAVEKLGADFYVFSGHKIYGPTGVGVVWGKRSRWAETEPVSFGGGMIGEVTEEVSTWASIPERFEGGTPPIGEVIGLGQAVKMVEDIGFDYIVEQESQVLKYALVELSKISGLKYWSAGQAGIIALVVEGVHPHDVATILDRRGVAVRAGHHCAMPLHHFLGVEATTRVSLGMYNETEDIDKLIKGIIEVKNIFKI